MIVLITNNAIFNWHTCAQSKVYKEMAYWQWARSHHPLTLNESKSLQSCSKAFPEEWTNSILMPMALKLNIKKHFWPFSVKFK